MKNEKREEERIEEKEERLSPLKRIITGFTGLFKENLDKNITD